MRDALLVLVMLGCIPWALRKPIVACVLYVIVSVMQPHKSTWGFAVNFPWAWVFGTVMVVSVFSRHASNLPRVLWQYKMPILFCSWVGITSVFALDQSVSIPKFIDLLKLLIAFTFLSLAINTSRDVIIIIATMVASIGFYAVKGSLWVIATLGSYSLAGPQDTAIADRNSLAVAFVMTIPLAYWLAKQATVKWHRVAYVTILVGCIVGTMGTYSRGGFLTLLIVGAFFLVRSNAKALTTVLLIPIAVSAFIFMPDKYVERLSTVKTYNEDASAMGRINAWKAAAGVAQDRLTGAGAMYYQNADNFKKYAPPGSEVLTAHSVYFQALGEHGYFGLALFISMFVFALIRLRLQIRKETKKNGKDSQRRQLMIVLELSLLTYLIGGAFLSLVYYEALYLLLAVCYVVLRNEAISFSRDEPKSPKQREAALASNLHAFGKRNLATPKNQ